MPYIRDEVKEKFNKMLDELKKAHGAQSSGELNYLFTVIADYYIVRQGLSYQKINDIIGALEGAKLELYRRIAVDYEEEKIIENGDVYTKRT